jgi:hypothetical protein
MPVNQKSSSDIQVPSRELKTLPRSFFHHQASKADKSITSASNPAQGDSTVEKEDIAPPVSFNPQPDSNHEENHIANRQSPTKRRQYPEIGLRLEEIIYDAMSLESITRDESGTWSSDWERFGPWTTLPRYARSNRLMFKTRTVSEYKGMPRTVYLRWNSREKIFYGATAFGPPLEWSLTRDEIDDLMLKPELGAKRQRRL